MVLAEAGLKQAQARVAAAIRVLVPHGLTVSVRLMPASMGQQFTAPRVVKGVKLNKLVAVLRLVLAAAASQRYCPLVAAQAVSSSPIPAKSRLSLFHGRSIRRSG